MAVKQSELTQGQFDSLIRMVKQADVSRVAVIASAVSRVMSKLKLHRDPSLAVAGTPLGSDQQNVGSAVTWINGVVGTDEAVVRQLRALDATLASRMI